MTEKRKQWRSHPHLGVQVHKLAASPVRNTGPLLRIPRPRCLTRSCCCTVPSSLQPRLTSEYITGDSARHTMTATRKHERAHALTRHKSYILIRSRGIVCREGLTARRSCVELNDVAENCNTCSRFKCLRCLICWS